MQHQSLGWIDVLGSFDLIDFPRLVSFSLDSDNGKLLLV
jgi:hypothetical protein